VKGDVGIAAEEDTGHCVC